MKSDPTYNWSSSNQPPSINFLSRSVWLQPRFRDKNLESRRKEFMRTLIKNPMKLLIIVERSKGERSIPEMDKVLDQSSTPAIQFRRSNSFKLSLYPNYPKYEIPLKPLKVDQKQE